MCSPSIIGAVIGSAVLSAGVSAYQGHQQRKASDSARDQAERRAADEAKAQEQEFNAANKRQPNVGALVSRNTNAAKSGLGSTLLTGSSGLATADLNLSQNTLLGA